MMSDTSYSTVKKLLGDSIKALVNDPDIQYTHVQNIASALIQIETILNGLIEHKHDIFHTDGYGGEDWIASKPVFYHTSQPTVKGENDE